MNILFLSQRVPDPPNKGDKIRSHHIMRRLARRHSVHVVCLADDTSDLEHVKATERWAASVTWRLRRRSESAVRGAASALSGGPITVGYFRSKGLENDLDRLCREQEFDVAVAYCSAMAMYARSFPGPKVLDLVDVDSEKWKQYAERTGHPRKAIYALEHKLLRSYEQKLVTEFDRSILVSRVERKILSRFADPSRVHVVSNGVDTEWLTRNGSTPARSTLVFVGALDYFANADGIIHFATQIFPSLTKRRPEARLRIVGRRPGPAVRALAGLPGVEVVGELDDIRPELWSASVAVVPLRIAQGVQNKVLEAMAAGVPVVSSRAAVRGLEGRDAEHYLACDTPEEWVNAIDRLLASPEEAFGLAARARELVLTKYSWERKALEYESVIESACRSRREEVALCEGMGA